MNIFEEKKIKVRDAVLALDLDGTLTDSKKRISDDSLIANPHKQRGMPKPHKPTLFSGC